MRKTSALYSLSMLTILSVLFTVSVTAATVPYYITREGVGDCTPEKFRNPLDIVYPAYLVPRAANCEGNTRDKALHEAIALREAKKTKIFKCEDGLREKFAASADDLKRALTAEFLANEAIIRSVIEDAFENKTPRETVRYVLAPTAKNVVLAPLRISTIGGTMYPLEVCNFYFVYCADRILNWLETFAKINAIDRNELFSELHAADFQSRILGYKARFFTPEKKLLLQPPCHHEVYMILHLHDAILTALGFLAAEARNPARSPKFYAIQL